MTLKNSMRNNKLIVMICTNLANLFCHSVYSVLASFFPQEAKAKGMSDDGVGLIFAIFAAVIFVCSPIAARLMSKHGKVWVYIWGICTVSVSSILFSVASGARRRCFSSALLLLLFRRVLPLSPSVPWAGAAAARSVRHGRLNRGSVDTSRNQRTDAVCSKWCMRARVPAQRCRAGGRLRRGALRCG